MQKFYFSIRTRGGLPIPRLMIAGRDQAEAERKLKQMYHHCEIISCDSSHKPQVKIHQNDFIPGFCAMFAKNESPTGKYPTL